MPFISVYERIINLIGYRSDEFTYFDFGFYGYDSTKVYGEYINVFEGGNRTRNSKGELTVCFELSGMACKDFRQRKGNFRDLWMYLLMLNNNVLSETNINITKVDVTMDVYTDRYFTIPKIQNKIKKFELTSNTFRKARAIQSYDLPKEVVDGDSVYLGSKSSNCHINIYDKLLEQIGHGEEVWLEHWYRIEMRFRHEKAMAVVNQYVVDGYKDFPAFVTGLLKGLVDFKIKNPNDTNKSRWKSCKWYSDLLQNAKVVKIDTSNFVKPKTIQKRRNWLFSSVSKTLTQMYCLNPDNFDNLVMELLLTKINDFNKQDLDMINKHRIYHNQGILKMDDINEYITQLESRYVND